MLKTVLIATLKFAVPLGIIVWLIASLEPQQIEQLQARSKNWSLLSLAFSMIFLSVCLTIIRWYLLVRALGMKFQLKDAFRLGFLSYLLNFVSVGSVGGDLFKAYFIAREQPGRRPEAVATVVVDRLIGIYALLIVASLAILMAGPGERSPETATICRMTLVLAAVGAVSLAVVLSPGFTTGAVSEMLGNLPKVGPIAARLVAAVRMYRGRPATLTVIAFLSVAVHSLLAVALYCLARGLFAMSTPTLAEHFVMVPLGMVAGALPFTPGGLGAFELALDKLYEWIPAGEPAASGVLVALAYRVVTILVAAVGAVVYWASRTAVDEIYREAEQAQERNESWEQATREQEEQEDLANEYGRAPHRRSEPGAAPQPRN